MFHLKRSLCALIAAAATTPAFAAPAPKSADASLRASAGSTAIAAADLRVMSFNLRVPFRLDGPNYWSHRKDLLVETVRRFQPDVLGTQECVNDQAWHLFKNLPNYAFVGVGRDRGDSKGEMTAIFFRTDKFRKLDVGHFWLSEEPHEPGSKGWDAGWKRMASWVKLQSIADGRRFVVFNTHFDVWGDEARYQSALLIRRKVREIAGNLPAIITGDFNDQEGSTPYNTLLAGSHQRDELFADTYREVHPRPGGNEGTRHGFGGDTDGPRIDWILTTPGFDTLAAGIDRTSRGGRYPSDHFPITAVLRWDDHETLARATAPGRTAHVGG